MRARRARRAGPAALIVCLAACAGAGVANAVAAPVAHVFLVQNSGWMEPFFSDPASPYKALVTELALAATQAGDVLLLAAFNQSLAGAPSPRALLSSTVEPAALRVRLAAALAPLDTARKPGGAALADTDLGEALGAAIAAAPRHRPGLVVSELQLPAAPLPGRWSLAALRSAGSACILPGAIELRLGEQGLPPAHGRAVSRRSAARGVHAAGARAGGAGGVAARSAGALRHRSAARADRRRAGPGRGGGGRARCA